MTYRERQERKAERLRDWADKRDAKADTVREQAQTIADGIPFGQPILVGHHSEKRHRKALDRIESGMRASVENGQKADEMRGRAEEIERQAKRAIYSDDPDAVERLGEKIAGLEAERERIKAYNKTCKAGQDHGDLSILTDREARGLLSTIRVAPYQCKNGRFPAYALQNLGGNITRLRKRLETLSRPAEQERPRVLTARYPGECRKCSGSVERGEQIAYYKRTREVECASCAGLTV